MCVCIYVCMCVYAWIIKLYRRQFSSSLNMNEGSNWPLPEKNNLQKAQSY